MHISFLRFNALAEVEPELRAAALRVADEADLKAVDVVVGGGRDVLDEFAEQCVLIADILRADDAKEASKWNEASLNDDDEEDENENEDQEDEDQEDEALIAALANSLTSSPSPSSSPGGEDDADPDDDEEAVISALAGSLR